MTEETIKQLQELLNQKAIKLQELSQYDEILEVNPDDVVVEFTVMGWHSGEKKMKLARMPKRIVDTLKAMRTDLQNELSDIQSKIDEL